MRQKLKACWLILKGKPVVFRVRTVKMSFEDVGTIYYFKHPDYTDFKIETVGGGGGGGSKPL